MIRRLQNSKHLFRPLLMGATQRRVCLSAAALMMTASLVYGSRPGGVAILLPPFIPVQAPQPYLPAVSPFDIIGFIQSATLDTPCTPSACADYFVGGTLEVDGLKIIVPRNTIFQMPATSMSWADMFKNAPAPYNTASPQQSGLALTDIPKPLTTYEVHVQGNRVINPTAGADKYIAGLIYVAQQAGTLGQGYINAIDYSTCAARVPALPAPVAPATVSGCMPDVWVGSTLTAKTGARLRLNSNKGRYGAPDPGADQRFTADENNPTIVARTGYPMCLPRFDPAALTGGNDSLCPQWNRPKDGFTTAFSVNYTFPTATAGVAGADGITHQVGYPNTTVHPDPFEQTPMEVGDYISYAGNLIQDVTPCVAGLPASSCMYLSAHTVTVELGLYTAPSTWPVYTFMSDFKFGVGGTPNPIFPQEAVEKIFGDFFTTDFSQLIDVYSEDVNSTTGASSHRFYGTSDPFGPPLGGLKGRARFRVTIGNFLPPTRNMAVASRALTLGAPIDSVINNPAVPAKLTANGLIAGFFSAPQFAYIFPENLILGTLQIPLTFQEFPFLANGSGPYCPWPASPQTPALCDSGAPPVGNIGQLSPWPDFSAPTALASSTGLTLLQPPVANAGPAQTVPSGSTVSLSASASTDPNVPALPLIYTWQQLSGPVVALLNVNNTQPLQSFVAPTLAAGAAPVVIAIQLAVCNGFTCGGAVTVNITVTAAAGAASVSLSSSKTFNIVPGIDTVILTAAATCGAAACPAGTPVTFAQPFGPKQILTLAGNTASFKVPAGTAVPAVLTFTATLGGSTSTVSVFVGPDTLTPINIVYQLAHSKLQVSVNTTALPKGAAIISVVPLVNKKVSGPAVVCTYDPVLDAYAILADIANPIPDSVQITSNYGGFIASTPVTRIR